MGWHEDGLASCAAISAGPQPRPCSSWCTGHKQLLPALRSKPAPPPRRPGAPQNHLAMHRIWRAALSMPDVVKKLLIMMPAQREGARASGHETLIVVRYQCKHLSTRC